MGSLARQGHTVPRCWERKIVTKETHQGCLSFAIHHPGAFMPPAVPRRPQAAESKPPRAGQRTAFFHRCPARPEKRGPGRRRHGTRPKRTTARAPERGPRPSLPPGRWGAPASQLQPPKRGRARAGQGLPAPPGAAETPPTTTQPPRGERPNRMAGGPQSPQARPPGLP